MLIVILIISIINFLSITIVANAMDKNNKAVEALKLENIRLLDILTELEKDVKKLGEK